MIKKGQDILKKFATIFRGNATGDFCRDPALKHNNANIFIWKHDAQYSPLEADLFLSLRSSESAQFSTEQVWPLQNAPAAGQMKTTFDYRLFISLIGLAVPVIVMLASFLPFISLKFWCQTFPCQFKDFQTCKLLSVYRPI